MRQGLVDKVQAFNPRAASRNEEGTAGAGSGSIVSFDIYQTDADEDFYWGSDPKGEKKWRQGSRTITLGHELIHAERYQRGVGREFTGRAENPENPYIGRRPPDGGAYDMTERVDELETIGTAPKYTSEIAENLLRREHGLNRRLSHKLIKKAYNKEQR